MPLVRRRRVILKQEGEGIESTLPHIYKDPQRQYNPVAGQLACWRLHLGGIRTDMGALTSAKQNEIGCSKITGCDFVAERTDKPAQPKACKSEFKCK